RNNFSKLPFERALSGKRLPLPAAAPDGGVGYPPELRTPDNGNECSSASSPPRTCRGPGGQRVVRCAVGSSVDPLTYLRMQSSFVIVRMNKLPSAMAGVAMHISPSELF